MSDITVEIGNRLRNFRKLRKLTLEELSEKVYKSKSTLSKYEKGEIAIDIDTLYQLADALNVHIEQLLYMKPASQSIATSPSSKPNFFAGLSQFYGYEFDGRDNHLIRCVFDVLSQTEENKYNIRMYMNFVDFEHYQACETSYYGYMEHFDALTNFSLTNQDTQMEKASLKVLASYLDAQTKWGLWTAVSSRPLMPISMKMLLSKKKLPEDQELYRKLKISKEDIRLLKLYNMLSVT